MTRSKLLVGSGVALVIASLAPLVQAQNDTMKDRFTFASTNRSEGGSGEKERLEIVVNRWSTDAERNHLLSVVTQEGPANVLNALRDAYMTGWLHWPGHLEYTLRYARRTPRPEGGEDVVLVADSRVWIWWDTALATDSTPSPFTVVHLRLNREGTGAGKISFGTKIRADKSAGIMLEDDASQPTLLTDVRRERGAS